jgi:anti-sigma factor RsiW
VTMTFTRRGEAIRWTLHRQEVGLLRQLVADLGAAIHGSADEAVHARLFPPAVLGDAAADAEVRDLIAEALLADRAAALEEVVALLDRGRSFRGRHVTDLLDDEPLRVLTVLNDVRLAIGARIDVEAIDRERVGEDDEVAFPLAVMDHLGWWQEQLLALLDGGG